VLRALGWSRRDILGLILREALYLGLLGGVASVFIGVGFAYLLTFIPLIGGALQPVWTLSVFVRAITIALLLGIIGGLLPAYRATRLQPVEALRYE
jgi:putative ABC transport system permease protein